MFWHWLKVYKFAAPIDLCMNPKLSLFVGILCIAFSPIFVKLVPLSALSAAFYRMFFAWIILAPYCLFYKNLRIPKRSLLIAIIGGLVFALDIAVWNISILKSTATISTLIANLAPVWVGVLSLLILKKQPGLSFWLGTLIAICGMCILVGINNLLRLQLNAGVLFALASSVLYAIYILITKDVLTRIDAIVFMFYSMLASTVALGVYCLFSGDQLWNYSAHTWIILIVLGIVCQLVGWITINYAIHHMDSTRVSIALLGQTIATALLAWIILGEHVDFIELMGGVIVLVGIGVTFVKRKAPAA
jgi:drug/metabolite transporter (DMT)-like permease